eukprot:snap_masked-scaffold_2-processed-gene-23.37-mRNA-1 protein AED:0.43 eAED:0.43 QI:0/-1/0/1/-1/1/1/0/498
MDLEDSENDDRLSQDENWLNEDEPIQDLIHKLKYHKTFSEFLEFYINKEPSFDILQVLCSLPQDDDFIGIKFANALRKEFLNINSDEEYKQQFLIFSNNLIDGLIYSSEEFLKPLIEHDPLISYLTAYVSNFSETESEQHDEQTMQKKENSSYYFDSYDNFSIHREMLGDKVRNRAYEEALKKYVDGKVVIDVGCGTGLLSFLSLKYGAKYIISIDNSNIIYTMQNTLEKNFPKEKDKVLILKGKAENFGKLILEDKSALERLNSVPWCVSKVIKEQKEIVLVSEWMGYALFFENMFASVRVVLEFLQTKLDKNVILIPCRANLEASFLTSRETKVAFDISKVDFSNICGLDFGFLNYQEERTNSVEAKVELVSPSRRCSNTQVLKEFDLNALSLSQIDFVAEVNFTLTENCIVDGIALQFTCFMDNDMNIKLSTSIPCNSSEATHWKQTVLYFNPRSKQKGETLSIKLKYSRNAVNQRNIEILLTIEEEDPVLYVLE